MKKQDITDTHLHIMRIVGKLNELDKNVSKAEIQTKILDLCVQVNVPPPIEAGASCFHENSTTDSEELQRLTLSPQA